MGSPTQHSGLEEISHSPFWVGTDVPGIAKVPSEKEEASFTSPSSTFHPAVLLSLF